MAVVCFGLIKVRVIQLSWTSGKKKFDIHGKKVNVDPDVIGDFRDMPFEDNTFNLVVFDPPHLKWAGQNSIMRSQYGQLDKVTWSEDLAKGFEECMRVLKVGGTLVFKWSDCQINVKEVLKSIPLNHCLANKEVLRIG